MHFIERILNAGFVEQGQKRLLELMPHKEKWIPKWWERYPYETGWLGTHVDHPDAWFRKEGEDKELILSLQGCAMANPRTMEDLHLLEHMAGRYICLKVGSEKIYETWSGKIPPAEIVETFINAKN